MGRPGICVRAGTVAWRPSSVKERGELDIDNGEVGRIGGYAGDEIAPLSTAAMIVKTRRSSLPCGCLPPQRRDQGFKWR
jgi:hypothetical protein